MIEGQWGRGDQDAHRITCRSSTVFTNDSGVLTGTASRQGRDSRAARHIAVAAQRVTWRQSVTKPMRLNLEFERRGRRRPG